MSDVSAACRDIFSKPTDSKLALYSALVDSLVADKDTTALLQVIAHLLNKEGSDQYGRTYIAPPSLLQLLSALSSDSCPIDVEDMTPLLQQTVEMLRPKHDDYPQPLCEAVDLLARCHQALDDYAKAAYALSSFRWDDVAKKGAAAAAAGQGGGGGAAGGTGSSNDWMRVERRVEWLVRTAEFFLAVQETGSASQQIKRAHALINELQPRTAQHDAAAASSASTASLILRFKTCYARVLDSERRFLEAALRYLELSHTSSPAMSAADTLTTLQHAVTCAILSKPSASRTRILSALHSDSRTHSLPLSFLLEKVYKGRIVLQDEIAQFESALAEHQRAETGRAGGGMTVVRGSLLEHNIAAVGRVYRSIGVGELSAVLGVGEEECERVTAEMIEQGRLRGKIDQVEGVVDFEEETARGGGGGGGGGAGTGAAGAGGAGAGSSVVSAAGGGGGASALSSVHHLLRWDAQIEDVCLQVNRIVESIQTRYTQYVL